MTPARPLRACLPIAAALLIACAALLALPSPAEAQLGALASPGPLARAHANLEGLSNCQKCHEPGRQVTASKCLSCHQPIAQRIARKKGVHREVTDDCVTCHVEHAGADADLRPLDTKTFDHPAETGFALEGLHAKLRGNCAACHKTRSFLVARPECASCHADPHKGTLAATCTTCHSTTAAFKDAARTFDHAKSAFPLTGKHQAVECAKCHKSKLFKDVAFASCTSCHKTPHAPTFSTACTSCHTTAAWRSVKVDHARTRFPLVGAHQRVECVKCHVRPATQVKPKSATCSDCHTDPHKGQFKAQGCDTCHDNTSFKRARGFDHAKQTAFALTGKHAAVECAKCHKSAAPSNVPLSKRTVDFRGASKACASCHSDPHRGELGTTCETCHGTSDFLVTSFTHPKRPEFYTAGHAAVACLKCHAGTRATTPTMPARTGAPVAGARFKGLPTTCVSCHTDVHLGQVGTTCEKCHGIDSVKFAPSTFSHDTSAFALTGKHRDVECAKCHKVEKAAFPGGMGEARRLTGLPKDCVSCHADVHLGQLKAPCQTCHTTSSFAVKTFTHKGLEHLFVGAHAKLECVQCHKKSDRVFPSGRGVAVTFKTGTECSSCHTDAHKGAMGPSCASCHSPDTWRTPNTGFHKLTTFPLEGQHVAVPCQSCHVKGQVKGTPTTCYDCHWIRRQDDRYRLQLGAQCGECHRPAAWTAVRFDHGARTGTALNVSHQVLACATCHKGNTFANTRPECVSCHEPDYRRTTNPNHAAAGFPLDCTVCHSPSAPTFAGARFSHDTFVLAGPHAAAACASCHKANVYKGTPRECIGCHQADYQRTTSPNHAAAGFPTACESCHRQTDSSWRGVSFNHAQFYPLAGGHAAATCASCHKNNVYKGLSRDCVSCHQADYQRAAAPNHAAAGFPTACESCHRTGGPGWQGANFNHNQYYALNGAHGAAACASCHKNGQYKGTSRDCVSCHQPDYQRAANPNHVAAGLPTACENCHRNGGPGWQGANFNHNQYYALNGAHGTAACASCHKNGQYKGTPRDCVGCHLATYQATKSPNHQAAGFTTACESCHRNGGPGWTGASINHAQFYPLLGRHSIANCASCHTNNTYKGTPRTCVPCHQADYQRPTNPNHVSAGFPTTCEQCHKEGGPGWTPATFNHATYFALQGAHTTLSCASCHKNNIYRGTARTCVGCHQARYDATRSPNHRAAGFPTACETCHRATDTLWTQGRFTHTWFPITSGKHANRACAECHQDPNNYKSFTCLTCHTRSETDKDHQGKNGYRYDSLACYSCHPDGRD